MVIYLYYAILLSYKVGISPLSRILVVPPFSKSWRVHTYLLAGIFTRNHCFCGLYFMTFKMCWWLAAICKFTSGTTMQIILRGASPIKFLMPPLLGLLWTLQLGELLPSCRPPNHQWVQDVQVAEELHHYSRRPQAALCA